MTIRDAADLRNLSAGERKKLTREVVKGANELQRKMVEQYDKQTGAKRPDGC